MRSLILALLLASASASAYADNMDWNRPPPADWPKLTVQQEVVSPHDLMSVCQRGARDSMGGGCALVDFAARTCRVYLVLFSPRDDVPMTNLEIWEHEVKGHCRGFDHKGESALRDAWARYKATRIR